MTAIALGKFRCADVDGQYVNVTITAQRPRLVVDRVVPAAFMDDDHTRTDGVSYLGPGENLPTIIEHAHDVPVFDPACLGIGGIDQAGFTPGHRVVITQHGAAQLRVQTVLRMLGRDMQGELGLRATGTFDRFHPHRMWRAVVVVHLLDVP